MSYSSSILKILFFLLLFFPLYVPAATFQCSINNVLKLAENGAIVKHGWSANYQDRQFTVDRETGRVINTTALKSRLSNYDKNSLPHVVDFGDKNDAYKAVTRFEEDGKYAVLEINQVSKTSGMPFIYHTGIGMILVGKCNDGDS